MELPDPGPFTISATGAARWWSKCLGDFSLTKELHWDRPVYRHSGGYHLYSLESGAWGVDGWVGVSQPGYRSTDPAPSPALCQNWEYRGSDGLKYNYIPGDIKITCS